MCHPQLFSERKEEKAHLPSFEVIIAPTPYSEHL